MSEELKEKLKEMLVIDFFRGVAKGDEKLVDGFTRDENLLPVLTPNGKAFIDQLLELFEEYVKEIIGGDDSTAVSSLGAERDKKIFESKFMQRRAFRNELRAEQRSRLELQKEKGKE